MSGSDGRRPWFRLHRSTWMMILICAPIQLLIVVPGQPAAVTFLYEAETKQGGLEATYCHGWPWVHFKSLRVEPSPDLASSLEPLDPANYSSPRSGPLTERQARFNPRWQKLERTRAAEWKDHYQELRTEASWTNLSRWKHQGHRQRIDLRGLTLNIIVLLVATALPAAIIESRMRADVRFFQMRIVDLLVVTTVVAVLLGWLHYERRMRQLGKQIKDSQASTSVQRTGWSFLEYSDAPVWLVRLIGPKRCEGFNRIRVINFSESNLEQYDRQTIDKISGLIRSYGKISTVYVLRTGPAVERLMSRVGNMKRVTVRGRANEQETWQALAKDQNWEKFDFVVVPSGR